jgi:hypothetical protein
MPTTIGLIEPSPTARARLAADLRTEFAVVEAAALSPALVEAGARLLVTAAEAVSPEVLWRAPYAALPCLVVGRFSAIPGDRPAPLRVVAPPNGQERLVAHARDLLAESRASEHTPPSVGVRSTVPFVPERVAWLLRHGARARAAGVPVLIVGEPGTGKRTAARTLHALAGEGSLIRLTAASAASLEEGRLSVAGGREGAGGVTLLADGIEAFPPEAEGALVEWLTDGLVPTAHGSCALWLVATTSADLENLARAGRFDAALAARLGEIVIELPPLRRRRDAVAGIAREVIAGIGVRLGAPLTLTPEAVARLEDHPWPGNVGELIRVLRRSAVLAPGDRLGPDDLLFALPGEVPSEAGPSPSAGAAAPAPPGGERRPPPAATTPLDGGDGTRSLPPRGDPRLELVLTELAHELKNPMVTIKTFADNLSALLEDADLRDRFATLTNEAIGRMDGLLENVLDFARLGTPRCEVVTLARVLDDALGAVDAELREREARVSRSGWNDGVSVPGDPKHLLYAYRNVFESLVGELPHGHQLSVRIEADGRVVVRLAGATGVAAKLQSFLEDGVGVPAPTALPLRFVLARAVFVRSGGEVVVESGEDGATLVTVVSGRRSSIAAQA